MKEKEKEDWFETRKLIHVGWLTEDEKRRIDNKTVEFIMRHNRPPSGRKELILDMAQQYKHA